MEKLFFEFGWLVTRRTTRVDAAVCVDVDARSVGQSAVHCRPPCPISEHFSPLTPAEQTGLSNFSPTGSVVAGEGTALPKANPSKRCRVSASNYAVRSKISPGLAQ